jgi:hypothetical protein
VQGDGTAVPVIDLTKSFKIEASGGGGRLQNGFSIGSVAADADDFKTQHEATPPTQIAGSVTPKFT